MAAIRHTAFLPLWSIPYVNSAVRRGYHPVPSKLPPDGNDIPSLQQQPHDFARPFIRFLAIAVFAKYIPLRKRLENDRITVYSSFFDLSIWHFRNALFEKSKLEAVVPQRLSAVFAKEYTLRKFLCHFLDRKKDAFRRPFYVIPFKNPIPSTALRL